IDVSKFADDVEVPSFASKVVCAKCGARGRHIDVRPNWKEQRTGPGLTGKQWRGATRQRPTRTPRRRRALSDRLPDGGRAPPSARGGALQKAKATPAQFVLRVFH